MKRVAVCRMLGMTMLCVGAMWSGRTIAWAQRSVATSSVAGLDNREMPDVFSRPVTVHVDGVSPAQALKAIADQASVRIQYRLPVLETVQRPVSLSVEQIPLKSALERLLAGTNLQIVQSGQNLITIMSEPVSISARSGTIVGKVVHAKTKQPVSGVRIQIDKTGMETVTGDDGTFRFSVDAGEYQVHVRGVGFVRQSRGVAVADGKAVTMEIQLDPTASVLDEVVVTGTVIATERREIATPITVITAADIEKRGITRLEDLFRGEVPGVYARERGLYVYGDALGRQAQSEIFVRGTADLEGNPNPLKTYVDGVEVAEPNFLGTIDPQTIERIEIIAGPQAASIYGSGAMGGVMQIFTKRGSGLNKPQGTLNVKYGILQSNVSTGKTPTHQDVVTLAGGIASALTYSGTISYNYSGQWQPGLFNRTLGASIGIAITQPRYSVNASANTNTGTNGTFSGESPFGQFKTLSGEWIRRNSSEAIGGQSSRRSTMSSQTISLSADHRIHPIWSQSGTVGLTFTSFASLPDRPTLNSPIDTLWRTASQQGVRTTASYHMAIQPVPVGFMSSAFTLGANYTTGTRLTVTTFSAKKDATGSYTLQSVQRSPNETSWGYFAQGRFGLFQSMYWTLGVRAELSPTFGSRHKIDWVPANGLAYTFDLGEMTLKLLASYGRATRVPSADMKSEILQRTCIGCAPEWIATQLENPELTPEYSRGPQGGFELFYGNRGSFSLNTFRQDVDALIQQVVVDSFYYENPANGYSTRYPRMQYQNTAAIRQKGWEGRSTLQLGVVSLGGTYSWNDTRVKWVNPKSSSWLYPGHSFYQTPSHFGNITANIARGGTSVFMIANWTGVTPSGLNWGTTARTEVFHDYYYSRLRTYVPIGHGTAVSRWGAQSLPGYWRSDVNILQRVTSTLSLSCNIKNIQNSYTSETAFLSPILGRTSIIGFTYRWQ